jgi:hypothetical protein
VGNGIYVQTVDNIYLRLQYTQIYTPKNYSNLSKALSVLPNSPLKLYFTLFRLFAEGGAWASSGRSLWFYGFAAMRGWETARIHFPPSSDPSCSRRVGTDGGKLVALAVLE